MSCEVCGAPVRQLYFHGCEEKFGQPTGPFFESRCHDVEGVHHIWDQLHNCVNPQPDECWLPGCDGTPPAAVVQVPACCR